MNWNKQEFINQYVGSYLGYAEHQLTEALKLDEKMLRAILEEELRFIKTLRSQAEELWIVQEKIINGGRNAG